MLILKKNMTFIIFFLKNFSVQALQVSRK